jgi:hypothetical protein
VGELLAVALKFVAVPGDEHTTEAPMIGFIAGTCEYPMEYKVRVKNKK